MLTLDDFKKLSDLLRMTRFHFAGEPTVEALNHLELCNIGTDISAKDDSDLPPDDIIDTGMLLEEVCKRYTDLQQEHAHLKTLCAKAGA